MKTFSLSHGRVKQDCFTLIELLVVIAIIAILAAILLPALNSSRERGRSIDCISMYKQLYHALDGYSNDNNDFIIKHQLVNSPTKFIDYWGGYLGYLGYIAPNGTNSAANFNKVAKSFLVCDTAVGLGSAARYSGYSVMYGKAISKCLAADPHQKNKRAFGNYASRRMKPSSLPYVVESKNWYSYYEPSDGQNWWTFIHNGRNNVLFLDGHASSIAKDKFTASNSNDWLYGTGKGFE